MMKRVLWLMLVVLAGWAAWAWLRQRQQTPASVAPQFAPPEPAEPLPFPAAALDSPLAAPPPPTSAPHTDALLDDAALSELFDEEREAAAIATPPEADAETEADALPDDDTHTSVVEREAAAIATPPDADAETEADALPDDDTHTSVVEREAAAIATPPETDEEADGAVAAPDETRNGEDANQDADADAEQDDDSTGITGYCVRCKAKREIVDPHQELTESGRNAARGTCPVCGTTMFTFLKEGTRVNEED